MQKVAQFILSQIVRVFKSSRSQAYIDAYALIQSNTKRIELDILNARFATTTVI